MFALLKRGGWRERTPCDIKEEKLIFESTEASHASSHCMPG